jgi:hypothetical protein
MRSSSPVTTKTHFFLLSKHQTHPRIVYFVVLKADAIQQEKPKQKQQVTDFGEQPGQQDAEDWLEVGPKNKMSITRDVQEEGKVSPISLIFGGRLRSVVKAQGLKASATLQPFNSLQLDISVCDFYFFYFLLFSFLFLL